MRRRYDPNNVHPPCYVDVSHGPSMHALTIFSLRQHSSGNKKAEEEADKATDVKLKEIKEIGKKSGNKVIEDLLKAVTDVKAEPPAAR